MLKGAKLEDYITMPSGYRGEGEIQALAQREAELFYADIFGEEPETEGGAGLDPDLNLLREQVRGLKNEK